MSTNSTTYAGWASDNYATPSRVSTGKKLLAGANTEAASFLDFIDLIEDFIDVGALANLLGAVPGQADAGEHKHHRHCGGGPSQEVGLPARCVHLVATAAAAEDRALILAGLQQDDQDEGDGQDDVENGEEELHGGSLRLVGASVDYGHEAAHVQACTPNKCAVDVWLTEQARGIVGLDASPILDSKLPGDKRGGAKSAHR